MFETPRIVIYPLSADQMRQYVAADGSLESALGLHHVPRSVSERVKQKTTTHILPAMANSANNPLLHTFWIIADKAQKTAVGECCFKGEPDEQGRVEIGYATYPGFEGKGYMTEAIGLMVKWAWQQEPVNGIIADTAVDNMVSQRVLEKNGFFKSFTMDDVITWAAPEVNNK